MATSPTFPISASVLFDAARALDRSPKPAPPAVTQPTLNTIAAATVYRREEPAPAPADRRAHERRYALAALEYECQKLAAAPESMRHTRRLNSACALGGFIPCGALSATEIENALFSARIPASNVEGERQTIRDGIRYGVAAPRVIPDRPYTTSSIGVDAEILENVDLVTKLRDYPRTDTGNAECLALLYGDQLRYCRDLGRGAWMAWDETRWNNDGDVTAAQATIIVARARQAAMLHIANPDERKRAVSFAISSEDQRRAAAMLNRAAVLPEFTTKLSHYDQHPFLAAVTNGTLDLATGELRESRREDYITMRYGCAYDPAATAPVWQASIASWFGGDQELIRYIQRAVGWTLTGDTRKAALFICFGGGANGKSKFLGALMDLLGDYAANTPFETFDASNRNDKGDDLAMLKGKRLVTAIETDEDRRLSEARVKAVTGKDPITCRFLYGTYFTYVPNYKIWFAVNHKPIVTGTDRGLWRRLKMIPFIQNFEGREDELLDEKLRAELPGILNWALDGLRAWQREGLGTCAVVDQATAEYQQESDLIGQWAAEATTDAADGWLTVAEGLRSCNEWCVSYGYKPVTANRLSRNLTEKGYQRGTNGRQRGFHGLRLAESSDAAPVFAVGDKAHDDRCAFNARAQLRVGNYAKAREWARQIRGVTQQAELERAIDEAEGASA